MINFDSERGIAVTTTPGRRTHSQLSITKAEVADSGNYTCAPSNSLPASIQVFVSGEWAKKSLKVVNDRLFGFVQICARQSVDDLTVCLHL